MIALTFDTDWAPDFVLEHLYARLEHHGLPATVFHTGKSALAPPPKVDCGLHPNFMPDSTQGHGPEDILYQLLAEYPNAKGIRTHRLYWHSGLIPLLTESGIRYDCTPFLPLHPGLTPVAIGGLTRFTTWWTDNLHLNLGLPFTLQSLPDLFEDGLKVLNFHPMLIYLNAASMPPYKECVAQHRDLRRITPKDLHPYRHPGPGIGDLFESMCEALATRDASMANLGELAA